MVCYQAVTGRSNRLLFAAPQCSADKWVANALQIKTFDSRTTLSDLQAGIDLARIDSKEAAISFGQIERLEFLMNDHWMVPNEIRTAFIVRRSAIIELCLNVRLKPVELSSALRSSANGCPALPSRTVHRIATHCHFGS